MRFRELEKIVRADGWTLKNTNGSQYHYVHPAKPGKATISYLSGDIDPLLVNSVLKQTQIKEVLL